MSYFIGIDIGGTFTDCAVLDDRGRIVTIAKAPTQRASLDRGVMDAVGAAARRMDIGADTLLTDCRFFVHGCTVATNAIVERKGVRTALLSSRGHEEAIFIGKASQKVAGLTTGEMTHQSHLEKADPPIVARRHALGISERIDAHGDTIVELNDGDVASAIEFLKQENIEAVAVSFLWSFLNNKHERKVAAKLRAALPDAYICTSHEIAPLIGEYERTATTVANAYVAPRLIDYIQRLEAGLHEAGYRYPLLLAHCMGGLTTMEEVCIRPLLTLDSGPVSGVLGARYFGELYGEDNIICADMGGTTFDVALIENGRYILDEEPVIGRYTCLIPKVAVESVGAGGGSILWIDDNGLLRVGPQSAGADPGPACYGRGGTDATITDVNLVLGYINEATFLGGEMKVEPADAENAIDAVATQLGMSRIETAAGAFRVVNAHMADLMRRTSIDRGRDPRDFVLFSYGGAGPLHAAYLARELGILRIYVPSFATVFSAMGMLTGGILHSAERSCAVNFPASETGLASLNSAFGTLHTQLDELFAREDIVPSGRRYERFVHMKYRLQPRALAVPVAGELATLLDMDDLLKRFEQIYADIYGANAAYGAAGAEIVKVRLDGASETVLPALSRLPLSKTSDPAGALKRHRRAYFIELGDYTDTPIYDGALLEAGMKLNGPAIIERMGDAIVMPAFATAEVDGYLNVIITLMEH